MDKLLRVKDIVRDNKSGNTNYLPISKSAWWLGVSEGRYPQPIKLGPRTTCWRESDILAIVNKV
jgi:predicted DNA-binding transcriptional regulator AlpA